MMMDGVLIVLGCTALVVVLALIGAALHERRGKELRKAADEMGFTYKFEDPVLAVELFGTAALTSRAQNVLRGQAQALEVIVCDLFQPMRQSRITLLVIRDQEANWPGFALHPHGGLHRLDERAAGTALFEDDAAFARRYRLAAAASRTSLTGADTEGVSSVFTESVRGYFAEHPGLWVQGEGQRLIYSAGKTVPASELRTFLADGFETMNLLKIGEQQESGDSPQ
jgi:hypothetical protein